jgi:hypothetical protein
VAQTRKRRRRKHRGTQGGRIDRRPARGRPRSRAEAKARAKSRGSRKKSADRGLSPPSWRSAFGKGLFAAVLFFVLLVLIFGRPPLPSALISLLMVGFYVPMSYYLDGFFYRRRLRQAQKERIEREQRRSGG